MLGACLRLCALARSPSQSLVSRTFRRVTMTVMRPRLLPAVIAVTILASGCGEVPTVSDAGATTAPTITSTTIYTSVTAPPVAVEDRAALTAEGEAFYAADRVAAEAAHAARYPNAAALQAKAEHIAERYRGEPGIWAIGAKPERDVVYVVVDDEVLYDTLIEDFADDPEVVIGFGYNCNLPLVGYLDPTTAPPRPEGCR